MMQKKLLVVIGFCICMPSEANIFKDIGNKFSEAIEDIKETGQDIFDKAKKAVDDITQNAKNIFVGEPKRVFCNVRSSQIYAPTVNNDQVINNDFEDMIPTIKKYSPVFYLCNERYYPVAVEDYFLAPTTQLVHQPNHKKNPSGPKSIVIPRGQVTMEKIYESSKKYTGQPQDLFFEIAECTIFGSNPKQFTDSKGNLTVPIYVNWSRYNDKIYIVYVFVYAFNGAYPISIPVIDVPILKGDIANLQGAHEFDLEHITLELDKNKKLERIFFSAHGKGEGVWVPVNHADVSYEDKTHPIVYAAHNGHGSYPREGTYVRIFGFGNDLTCKTQKWVPQLVLMYPDTDSRFNPKTMGWAYHAGEYGIRGVGSYKRFFNGESDLPKGQPYSKLQFCPNPKSQKSLKDWAQYRMCIEGKRPNAKISG